MSPVAMCGTPYSSAIRFAWVPLPDPCGPSRRMSSAMAPLLQEAFVGAHHHLRLHLPHRVECYTDHDQHGGASEGPGGRLREAEVVDEDARRDRDDRQVERPWKGEAGQHAVEIGRRRRPGSDPGDVAAVLAQVVGLVDRVE